MIDSNKQLEMWLNGDPVHAEQCCPDFSCCTKKLAPLEVRQRFFRAVKDNDEKTRLEMLGMFLGEALSSEKSYVYIAGLEANDEQ